jgi:hypothetical protein
MLLLCQKLYLCLDLIMPVFAMFSFHSFSSIHVNTIYLHYFFKKLSYFGILIKAAF